MNILENISIIKYAIELEEGKQQPYGQIYSLKTVEVKTLRTYIETDLKTEFIKIF